MGLSEDLIVTSPIHKEFICGICQEVLLDPVLVDRCEHVFCKSCIDDWTNRAEGKATCPLDRQDILILKALPRPFMNLYYDLQVRCKLHASGCEVTMAIGDIQDHPQLCEVNPEFKKVCLHGCGAILMKREIEGHNCITFLKTTIEELKTNAQLDSEKLTKEVNLLKLNYQKRTNFLSTKLIAAEKNFLKDKITSMFIDITKKPELIEQRVKKLIVEVLQAKRSLKHLELAPEEGVWLKKTITEYEYLEQALEPMSLEMQTDVKSKFGEWFKNFRAGAEHEAKLSKINQELSHKYGGIFINTIIYKSQTNIDKLTRSMHFEPDEQICRMVFRTYEAVSKAERLVQRFRQKRGNPQTEKLRIPVNVFRI